MYAAEEVCFGQNGTATHFWLFTFFSFGIRWAWWETPWLAYVIDWIEVQNISLRLPLTSFMKLCKLQLKNIHHDKELNMLQCTLLLSKISTSQCSIKEQCIGLLHRGLSRFCTVPYGGLCPTINWLPRYFSTTNYESDLKALRNIIQNVCDNKHVISGNGSHQQVRSSSSLTNLTFVLSKRCLSWNINYAFF